ncbi:hypothetical protein PoB_006798800 [Plakobranchus ocellatus]|uniref:Uncharacterized protein n=1 Tax=Plakobranchus ocellatus TaxID=259542 RepID=A0AAV4DBR5_9GAST|nr:hypothetical protein PoB_006798800 [Plakobranchus ocellatus]
MGKGHNTEVVEVAWNILLKDKCGELALGTFWSALVHEKKCRPMGKDENNFMTVTERKSNSRWDGSGQQQWREELQLIKQQLANDRWNGPRAARMEKALRNLWISYLSFVVRTMAERKSNRAGAMGWIRTARMDTGIAYCQNRIGWLMDRRKVADPSTRDDQPN